MSQDDVKRGALNAPSEVYLGIFEHAEDVQRVTKDLGVQGTEVLVGSQDEIDFEHATVRRIELGGASNALRRLFAADEVEAEEHYQEALQNGAFVVQIPVAEDDESARRRVEKIMLGEGGRFVHYFGRLTFEEVVADKEEGGL